MTRVARAIEKGEPQGFMKVMVDEQSHAILGRPPFWGLAATKPFTVILDTMSAKAPFETLRDTVHIPPPCRSSFQRF